MSIRLMSMIFERYPEGGSEMLLALAMADHANDDGARIWPSLDELARKTRQSRRTVQRQIAKMLASGWLEQVRTATGRPGATNEYRVCPAWVAGAELPKTGVNVTPVEDSPELATGDTLTPLALQQVVHTGDKVTPVRKGERGVTCDARGVTGDARGDTAMSPESSGTIKNHTPLPPDGGRTASKPFGRSIRTTTTGRRQSGDTAGSRRAPRCSRPCARPSRHKGSARDGRRTAESSCPSSRPGFAMSVGATSRPLLA